jgi:mandelate racemase
MGRRVGTISESPLVLTDVVAEDGTTGHSMIFTDAGAALKPTADLFKKLEPTVKGELLTPIEMANRLAKRFRLLGLQGLVAMAVSDGGRIAPRRNDYLDVEQWSRTIVRSSIEQEIVRPF